jgi:hypothetical protein
MMNPKQVIYYFSFSVLILCFSFLGPKIVNQISAQTFSSPSYKIQWGNFNMTSGKKTSPNYTLTDTVGQNAPGQFDSAGYVLKSGAQYAYENQVKFSFKIDDLNIDFGVISPNIGSTDSNVITVSTPSGKGYEILAREDHPLTSFFGNHTIPDTKCDSGTCSESTSGVWTGSSAYGFGFNAIGINDSGVATNVGTSAYFPNSTYFRQFANASASEINQVIMSENNQVKEHSAKITYRVVIGPNQSSGEYQNTINFIAVPKY